MVFSLKLLTSSVLLATLLLIHTDSVHGLCLPCNLSSRGKTTDIVRYTLAGGLAHRDVYTPKITNPTAATTWVPGSQATVTWDLGDMPEHITYLIGKLVLGRMEQGSLNEHLDLQHPLADNFDIRQGQVTFKFPEAESGNGYTVVLFGDSGNRSEPFTVKNEVKAS